MKLRCLCHGCSAEPSRTAAALGFAGCNEQAPSAFLGLGAGKQIHPGKPGQKAPRGVGAGVSESIRGCDGVSELRTFAGFVSSRANCFDL